uniref:Uncharacterized protein n=1 Tax=Rhizophora mucronata TaxID=61149 RepID=A0A2P2P3A4_RHIMU
MVKTSFHTWVVSNASILLPRVSIFPATLVFPYRICSYILERFYQDTIFFSTSSFFCFYLCHK